MRVIKSLTSNIPWLKDLTQRKSEKRGNHLLMMVNKPVIEVSDVSYNRLCGPQGHLL